MKNKHTPGPWQLQGEGIVNDPTNNAPMLTKRIETTLGFIEVIDETNEPGYNLALIAAAPELLSALEEIELRLTQDRIASTIGRQTLKQADFLRSAMDRIALLARAAISKATA